MQILWWAILILYLAENCFEYWIMVLNIRHLKKHTTVPEELREVLTVETLQKSQSYLSDNAKLSVATSVFNVFLILIFLFGGGLNLYHNWLMSFAMPILPMAILYFFFLSAAEGILNIPFDLYSHFKIEARYGFNNMKLGLWISDFIKSFIISAILLSIVVTAGVLLVEFAPSFWWILVWGFFLIFSIFIMLISPYVIEPLFNKFTPIDDAELGEKIKSLMEKVGISVSNIYKIDASKRSGHSNAYFTGIGKVKRIVFYDTLLEKLTHNEILAVLAHEAGHWKKKHIMKTLVLTEVLSLGVIYLVFWVMQNDWLSAIFAIQNGNILSNVLLSGFMLGVAGYFMTPVSNAFSRSNEREADQFAVSLCGGEALVSALIKIHSENLSNVYPHPLYSALHYSHPPLLERIRFINSIKETNQ